MESDLQEVLILAQEIGDLDIEDETEQQAANGLREIQRMSKKINRKGRETARSFREAANILDELWKATNKGRAVGTSVCIVGGLLTIGGGVATVMTAGAASPLLLFGMTAGFTGGGVNLVASYMEASVNSVQIKKAEKDWMETVDYIKKMKSTAQLWLNSESTRLWFRDLAERHSRLDLHSLAGGFFPSLVTGCTYLQKSAAEAMAKASAQAAEDGAQAAAKTAAQLGDDVAQAVTKTGAQVADDVAQASAKAGAKAGKVAGGVIIGVSAFFLAWDLYDLHCTITDLVKNKGSDAAKFLRAKADELEKICSYL